MVKPVGSEYINEKRRDFSLYTLQHRAIPAISDGLKPAARRVLWTARDGKKVKSASLAGATMPIHPHAAPETVINTIAAPYGNNTPLLDGIGAFGTLLVPDGYSASRYTSVKVSEFTRDVIFADIDIIPMIENYDSTLMEPFHFLPLVPVCLINPSEGIAVGYATTILPRTLQDVVIAQLTYLGGGEIGPITPTFVPTKNTAVFEDGKWVFKGEFVRENSTTLKIVNLPYGLTHSKFVRDEKSKLNKLLENGAILDYEDHSKDIIAIRIKFKRGELAKLTDDKIMSLFGLVRNASENLNVLNFNGKSVLSGCSEVEIIKLFTDWRLGWYVKRYERLKSLLEQDMQRYRDIITAIDNDAGKVASTKRNKSDFIDWLTGIGIVNVEYIATLPTYRYTMDEREKVAKTLTAAEKQLAEYVSIISSDVKRKNIYKKELQDVLKKFGK